ncbi:MAG: LysM peptidoglycan-binding domain-containing protein [Puniceicoccales bacterium]|jgi:LysM repeat protein|nr:LysM peptidoglycan-binding domain-containing protein [Puniceicoccales bacterium]
MTTLPEKLRSAPQRTAPPPAPLGKTSAARAPRRRFVAAALNTFGALAAVALTGATAGALAGCDRSRKDRPARALPEREDALFRAAMRKKANDPQGAISDLLRLNASRLGEGPETHYELGLLFQSARDWFMAVHHFTMFLRLSPANERRAPQVRNAVSQAKVEIARTIMPGHDRDSDTELRNALEQIEGLKNERRKMQQQLAALQEQVRHAPTGGRGAQAVELPQSATSPAKPPPPAKARFKSNIPKTYTVRRRDTLTRISQEAYGTPHRWREIFNANRDKLKSENTPIREGWVLRIP